jgi:hypothetical protein
MEYSQLNVVVPPLRSHRIRSSINFSPPSQKMVPISLHPMRLFGGSYDKNTIWGSSPFWTKTLYLLWHHYHELDPCFAPEGCALTLTLFLDFPSFSMKRGVCTRWNLLSSGWECDNYLSTAYPKGSVHFFFKGPKIVYTHISSCIMRTFQNQDCLFLNKI